MKAPQADAIVVISGGRHPAPGSARLSEWHDHDRFLAGLDLFRAGKAPRLLFPGGVSPFRPGQRPESRHYLQEAALLGVPEVAIRRLLPARQSRVLLVISAMHVLTFPVHFLACGRWAGPLWRDPTQWLPSAGALDNSSRAMRGLLGRLVYRAW